MTAITVNGSQFDVKRAGQTTTVTDADGFVAGWVERRTVTVKRGWELKETVQHFARCADGYELGGAPTRKSALEALAMRWSNVRERVTGQAFVSDAEAVAEEAPVADAPDYSDAAYSRGDTVTHRHTGMCVRSGHIGGNDRCDRCGALQSWAYDEAHEATITGISFGSGDITIDGTVKRGSYGSDHFTLVVKSYGEVTGTIRGLSVPKMRFSADDLEGWSPITVHGALLVSASALGCPVTIGGSENNRRWLSERLDTEAVTRTPEEASEAVSDETSPVSDAEAVSPKPRLTFRGRRAGVAGQFSVDVIATYPEEASRLVSFVGNRAGGPVVMVTGEGVSGQTFVYDPNRFGSFADDPTGWVRRFFA